MNHIYKSVWQSERGTYVAVSENTKGRGKSSTSSKARRCMSSLTVVGATIAAVLSFSLPTSAAQPQLASDENGHVNIGGIMNKVGGEEDFAGGIYTGINHIAIGDGNVLERDYSIGIGYGNSGGYGVVALTENLGMVTFLEYQANIASGVWETDPLSGAVRDKEGNYLFNMVELFDWAFDEEGDLFLNATERYATGYASVAMGVGNHASGYQSVGIGSYNVVGGKNSVSLGVKNVSNGDENVVLGSGNVLTGDQSIAIGTNNSVSGAQSIAIGVGHTISGNHSGAFGDPITITGSGSYGVGNNISIGSDDSFVMGSDVTIAQDHDKAVALGAGTAVNVYGGVALGAGSVANRAAGMPGYIPAGATASQQAVIEATTSTLAGVSVGDADNGLFRQIHGVAAGTDDSDAVNVSQLNVAAAAASNSVSNKDGNLTVNGTPNDNGSTDYSVGLADNITIGSGTNAVNIDGTTGEISVGDTTINGDGISISGGPSVTKNGIDAAGNKVTNVADGNIAADSKDAVNGGQIADLVSNINTDIANAAAASKTEVKAGSTNVTIVNGTDATDGHSTYTVDVAKDLKIDSVNTGGTVINDKGLSFVDDQGNAVANSPSISSSGINAGNQKITGVVNGVVNDTSTDAVNGSQLNTTNQYIASSLGGGAGYDNITGSFTHPTYNVNGGSHNNVGDALTALDDRDNQLDNKITNLGDQLQQAFYTTSERINDVEKRANAGIAAAMALETAPYVAGKWTYAAATAYHGGENAVGVTFRKTADNGRWSLTSGVAAASQGDPSFRIGISGVID